MQLMPRWPYTSFSAAGGGLEAASAAAGFDAAVAVVGKGGVGVGSGSGRACMAEEAGTKASR